MFKLLFLSYFKCYESEICRIIIADIEHSAADNNLCYCFVSIYLKSGNNLIDIILVIGQFYRSR